VGVYLDYAPGE